MGARAPSRGQYTSAAYTQVLDDHRVLASVGSVDDAYDNAIAESFVDSFKTELITDRVWRTRTQLELAVVEYITWFNHDRLHFALDDIPPVEFEDLAALRCRAITETGTERDLPQTGIDRLALLERLGRRDRRGRQADRPAGAGLAGDPTVDDGVGREPDLRRVVPRRDRRAVTVLDQPQAGGLPRARSEGPPVRRGTHCARSTSGPAPGAVTAKRSSRPPANSPSCSGACCAAAWTTPTSVPR
jgi:Integrase core domain